MLLERPAIWAMPSPPWATWLRLHLSPLSQMAAFLVGAGVLIALGTTGTTASLFRSMWYPRSTFSLVWKPSRPGTVNDFDSEFVAFCMFGTETMTSTTQNAMTSQGRRTTR